MTAPNKRDQAAADRILTASVNKAIADIYADRDLDVIALMLAGATEAAGLLLDPAPFLLDTTPA